MFLSMTGDSRTALRDFRLPGPYRARFPAAVRLGMVMADVRHATVAGCPSGGIADITRSKPAQTICRTKSRPAARTALNRTDPKWMVCEGDKLACASPCPMR